ncbi:PspC domain-containing protein [Parablastomonas sp. CN1-191]|uniref:PspC domain-containing protein n=1 Tax=Parablastomonas sp. CN1-191 TaxID=3400908 RepID=UPI003BF914AD
MSALDRRDAVRPAPSGFRLDKANGKMMGVCAGIADHFGIDATLVRLGFVAGALLGFGSLVVVYIAIGLIAD